MLFSSFVGVTNASSLVRWESPDEAAGSLYSASQPRVLDKRLQFFTIASFQVQMGQSLPLWHRSGAVGTSVTSPGLW